MYHMDMQYSKIDKTKTNTIISLKYILLYKTNRKITRHLRHIQQANLSLFCVPLLLNNHRFL